MVTRHYFHSPFSDAVPLSKKERALLVSFALSEIFACVHEEPKNWTFFQISQEKSYDAPLNRLEEHANLLLLSFPLHKTLILELKDEIAHIRYFIAKQADFLSTVHLKKLLCLLKPLIKECKEDKNLLFFLLTSQDKFSSFFGSKFLADFLKELYPGNLCDLQVVLCDYFHKKGFSGLLPEISSLFHKIQKELV